MVVKKICPFRTYENLDGKCDSNCQLFIPAKDIQEGKCALSYLPVLNGSITGLTQVIVTVSRSNPMR